MIMLGLKMVGEIPFREVSTSPFSFWSYMSNIAVGVLSSGACLFILNGSYETLFYVSLTVT
jgi:hypothetical protein